MRCVLTDDKRPASVEMLGDVDIVESTHRRRLVIRIETRSTHTHEATMWLLQWQPVLTVVVLQLIRGNAIALPIRH